MIEEYVKLLESFKEHQISKLIETINTKTLEALRSPKFNSRIAPYLKNRNRKGVPFTNFEQDPDNISQIKKLINALYHGRLAFIDLENIDVRKLNRTVFDFKLIYSNTIHEAYQACYLLTHLDVDLRGIFDEEIKIIQPLLEKFQSWSERASQEKIRFTEKLKSYPLSYNAGLVSGIALDQIKPSNNEIDFTFLTEFSAVLPGYLDQFCQYISNIEKESKLSQANILELQNAAYTLLSNLDSLQSRSFFAPLKLLNYLHIIRQTITLAMSTLEQIGNISESSQDVIRDNLAKLKYNVLPTLFGLVDKIEDNAMLKPGTLSTPLMAKVKPLYELLIYYAAKPVDFNVKGEELLSIEDSRFLSLRLELTYKRIDESNKSLIKIQKAQEALNEFFKLLENPLYQTYTIRQLPVDVKTQLILHYKLIKPYMGQVDVDLNDMLIDSLTSSESWPGYLNRPLRWATGILPEDHTTKVVLKKAALQTLISKNRESQLFHIKLNEDLIESVQKKSDLTLFPYNGENVFAIDEALGIMPEHGSIKAECVDGQIVRNDSNLKKLNSEQTLDLYQWYRNKHNKFMIASKAYHGLMDLLAKAEVKHVTKGTVLHLNDLDKEDLAECRNLYNLIQPYFMSGVKPADKDNALAIDKYLSHLLSGKPTESPGFTIDAIRQFDEHFQVYFSKIDREWHTKSQGFLALARELYQQETAAAPLDKDIHTAKRAHYLIKHTHYSKFVFEFRKNLFQLVSLLNEPMQADLKAQSPGYFSSSVLPFPELEDPNATLRQCEQVIAIKRIFNSLYHAEGIFLELEKLNNKHSETRYVFHLLQGYGHINEIVKLTKALYQDPHFRLIGRQIFEKAQRILATIQEHSDAYQTSHEAIQDENTVKINSLWYVLNAFYLSPKHIRTIRNKNYTTAEELDELHRNAKLSAVRIEAIIDNSDSYFKLFLQTPSMLGLYIDLTNKLNEFTSTAHDAVMNNLSNIKSDIITPMLIEADRWEDKTGLKPGSLSGPLKEITDEYFRGLLQPLGLDSKTHITLFCDTQTFEKREQRALNKIEMAQKHLKKIEKNYKVIESLDNAIKTYLFIFDENFPGTELEQQTAEIELIKQYKAALPKLFVLNKKLAIEPSTNQDDEIFDDLLNSSTNEYDPKFSNIKALVTGCISYYQGIRATYDMKSNTAKEKVNYLSALSEKQKTDDQLFIDRYTESSFNKQLEAYCNRHLGLQFVHNEYRKKLNEYLLTFKTSIIQNSKDKNDINLTIKNLLEDQIKVFEKDHFATFYQLDTIRGALAQFTLYFSYAHTSIQNGSSTFESKETLEQKTILINSLNDVAETGQLPINELIRQLNLSKRAEVDKQSLIADLTPYTETGHLTIEEQVSQIKLNTTLDEFEKSHKIRKLNNLADKVKLTVEERITWIKTKVEPVRFKGIILAHHHPDFFSIAFLKQCFFAVLEALYLYKPARLNLYNKINEAVNAQPQMSELTGRFGLFAVTPAPVKEYQIPELPISAAPAV